MLILERLTSRSSRSLAVMTGFAQSATGRGQCDPLAGPRVCRMPAAVACPPLVPFPQFLPQQVKE